MHSQVKAKVGLRIMPGVIFAVLDQIFLRAFFVGVNFVYDAVGTMGGGWGNGSNEEDDIALTSDQRLRIQELKNRDSEFDQHLDQIGEGIQDLADIAAMQGEEVKRQNVMLDNLGKRIDNVHEHVTTVNSKMKDTLTEVGRSSDKLCVDIICVVSSKVRKTRN
jgi:hypothetical protein